MLEFLNSALGLLLVGAAVGAFGLFTWQRRDWLFKEEYQRNQVLLDKRVALVERINSDVGVFTASAENLIAAIYKDLSIDQRDKTTESYNIIQEEWYGKLSASHGALVSVYFPPSSSTYFTNEILTGSRDIDPLVYIYGESPSKENFDAAISSTQQLRRALQEWNGLIAPYVR